MADMEVLAPGGHQHLVGKIKEQLAMKADAAMVDAVDKVARNQATREVEGELVSVEDAYAAPMLDMVVDGKSTQIRTTGKNLWNDARYSGVGWTYEGAGYYHGKIASFCNNITDLGNGSYPENAQVTISLNMVKTGSSGSIQLGFAYTDGTSSETSNITSSKYKYSYTSAAGKTVARAYISTSAGSSNTNFHFSRLQVEIGTSRTEYEPYTGNAASPSPTYPQQIDSIAEPSVTLTGKNLIDGSTDAWEVGSLDHIGQNLDGNIRLRTKGYIRLQQDSYTISVSSGYLVLWVYFYDGEKNFLIRANPSSETFQIALTDAAYARILLSDADTTSEVTLDDVSAAQPMLVMGTEAAPYEPYVGHTVPLYDGTLRSMPDGPRDTLALTYLRPSTREGWAWYDRELVQGVTTAIIDGTETDWWKSTSYSGGYYRRAWASSRGIARTNNHLQDRFATATSTSTYTVGTCLIDESLNFRVDNDLYPTLADFKAWLVENPVTIQYPLATLVTTTLDPIELPILPAPTCTVWADPTTGLQMEYVQDTQIVIDLLNAEIDRAHAAIAPIEHGTSSANYAVGSYLMLDGTFCKVTSAIATGETIAIGTNVVATTVDAELASLA